jgi:hypothetical protein
MRTDGLVIRQLEGQRLPERPFLQGALSDYVAVHMLAIALFDCVVVQVRPNAAAYLASVRAWSA